MSRLYNYPGHQRRIVFTGRVRRRPYQPPLPADDVVDDRQPVTVVDHIAEFGRRLAAFKQLACSLPDDEVG